MGHRLRMAGWAYLGAAVLLLPVEAGAFGGKAQTAKMLIPDFGPNVLLFDPTDPIQKINGTLRAIEKKSTGWDSSRTAIFFLPGAYGEVASGEQATAKNFVSSVIGVMTSVQGLGESPEDVSINGNLRVLGNLGTFWRSLEYLRVIPVDPEAPNTLRFIVSEASPIRRLDVAGDLDLGEGHIAFGAAIGNTRVRGVVKSGNARGTDIRNAAAQAHYYSQNSQIEGWTGRSLNFVFTGVKGAPPTAHLSQYHERLALWPRWV